jgi:hypothetical protein
VQNNKTATLADAETRAILGGTCQCSKWKPAVNRDIAANLENNKNKLTVLQHKIVQE